MVVARFRKALGKTRRMGMFSRLRTSVTRAKASDTERQLGRQVKRQRRRIRAQRRKIEAQAERIETQAKRSDAQAKRIEIYERRFERIIELLSDRDLQGAMWEAGKSYEVYWWRWFLQRNIRRQTEEFKRRFDPDQPLQD